MTDTSTNTTASILSLSLWMVRVADYVESTIKVPFFHVVLEVVLVLWIIRLLTRKSYYPRESKLELTKEEEDRLIRDWQPESLIPTDEVIPEYVLNPKLVDGKPGYRITIDGKDCLNLCTMNFLGFVGNKEIEESAIKTLRKYGVGTCGPRGFYGTLDVHLTLEQKLAKYLGTEEAILYSYGFATISSAIPAYSKRTDVIFCDKGVNFAIQKGVVASRSKVYWFNHNDMSDLEKKLVEQQEKDKKNPKKAAVTRRFLVVEGLYTNYGDVVPLPKLVELKNKYKVRVFIDETMSFGVLGKHGKGVTEHFNIPLSEIDLMAVSLECSLGSVGGFCAGSSFVIDHQRLAGAGYCFSASLPALLTVAAQTGLEIMEKDNSLFKQLENCTKEFRESIKGINGLTVEGSDCSPVIHLRLKNNDICDKESLLQKFVDKCLDQGIALTMARYLRNSELYPPQPSIRISINANLKSADIRSSTNTMKDVAEKLF